MRCVSVACYISSYVTGNFGSAKPRLCAFGGALLCGGGAATRARLDIAFACLALQHRLLVSDFAQFASTANCTLRNASPLVCDVRFDFLRLTNRPVNETAPLDCYFIVFFLNVGARLDISGRCDKAISSPSSPRSS